MRLQQQRTSGRQHGTRQRAAVAAHLPVAVTARPAAASLVVAPAPPHRLTPGGPSPASRAQAHRLQPCRAAAVEVAPAASTVFDADNVPRGETAGAVLVLNQVSLQAGDRDLMTDVDFRVMPGQRWGLVGANGCGKSTLLRALCGIRQVDTGSVIVAPKVAVGYLEQTAVSGSQRTVWEEARSQMTSLIKAELDMAQAMAALEADEVGAAEQLAAAQEAFVMADGPESDKRITNVLTGLGFRQEQFHVPASQFSGGWQMRIALARLLLGEAGQAAASGLKGGLMLLDEPTNHLDSAAIKWLGSFLRQSGGTLVVVSHDEALLDDVCDHIAEVRGRKIHTYVGSYNKFLTQRTEREVQARATAAAQLQEIERLEAWVARFGAKATKASAAQSKAKLAAKLRAEMVEVPVAASSEGGGDAKKVALKLPRAPPCFTDVLVLEKATVGWGSPPAPGGTPAPSAAAAPAAAAAAGAAVAEPQPGSKALLEGVDLVIKKGQRVLVLGPNGAGKSTLLKALSGSLPLWSGTRKMGEGVKLGVFSQDLAQDLPQDVTGLAYVEGMARAHNPQTTLEQCRKALGALGLADSMVSQPIGVLSGGEKARVALAAFALVPANVLLLDEASNHLDAATIKVLTGALQEFQGAIVAITHNPAFARSLNATHVLRVAGGKAQLAMNMGLKDEDFEHPAAAGSAATANSAATASVSGTPASTRGATPAPGGGAERTGGRGSRRGSDRSSGSRSPTPPSSATAAAAAVTAKAAAPAKAGGAKRTTLSWREQQEYQKLGKETEALTARRDKLAAKVAEMASASGTDFKLLEAASVELSQVEDKLEKNELRWLELAALAGDI